MCHDPAECKRAIAYWDALYAGEAEEEAKWRREQAEREQAQTEQQQQQEVSEQK